MDLERLKGGRIGIFVNQALRKSMVYEGQEVSLRIEVFGKILSSQAPDGW